MFHLVIHQKINGKYKENKINIKNYLWHQCFITNIIKIFINLIVEKLGDLIHLYLLNKIKMKIKFITFIIFFVKSKWHNHTRQILSGFSPT